MHSHSPSFRALLALLFCISVPLPTLAMPDVAVLGVEAPERLFLEREGEVRATIANLGSSPAAGFHYRVVLSQTRHITLYDDVLLEDGPIALDAGSEAVLVMDFPVPEHIALGSYYVGVILDPERSLEEANRLNNALAAEHPTELLEPAPNLAVTGVSASPRGASGETIRVDFALHNHGAASSGFDYGIYLTTGETPRPTDLLLFRAAYSLEPGESAPHADYVLLPAALPAGEYYVGVIADPDEELEDLDRASNAASSASPILVEEAALRLAPSWVPRGVVGQSYAWRFSALGGPEEPVYAIGSGGLPPGLAFDPVTAEIGGVPEGEGEWSFVLEVRSGAFSASTAYLLQVVERRPDLLLSTDFLVPAVKDEAYDMRLAATGGSPPYYWSAGGLPSGLGLDEAGRIHGAATNLGTFPVELCVHDQAGASECGDLTLRVIQSGNLVILTGALPPGEVGLDYPPTELRVTGATGSLRWSVAEGRLPPGLTIAADTGSFQGTPTEAGRSSFRIRVVDEAGLADENAFAISVTAESLTIATTEVAVAEIGEEYEQSFEVEPGQAREPLRWGLLSGTLPGGLSLDEDAGTIHGVPEAGGEGRHVFGIRVTDAAGAEGMRAFVLNVGSDEREEALSIQPEGEGGCASVPGGSALGSAALVTLVLFGFGFLRRARMGAAALLAAGLLSPGQASGEQWLYTAMQVPQPYQEITGGTVLTEISNDADARTTVSLPFPFEFFGETYDSITIVSNGFVALEPISHHHWTNNPIPDIADPNGIVAAWWTDLDTRPPAAKVRTDVIGEAPARTFVIQWENIDYWASQQGSVGVQANFQVRLRETSTIIEAHYGSFEGISNRGASVGIENQDGTVGVVGLSCTPSCAEADFPSDTKIVYGTVPHLVASSVQAPETVWIGRPLEVSGTVANIGGEDSGPFEVAAVIAESPESILFGLEVGRAHVTSGLQAGESHALTINGTVPPSLVSDRDYWVSLVPDPDGELMEGFGTHATPVMVRVGPDRANPRVRSVIPAVTEVEVGGTFDVSYEIDNFGNSETVVPYTIVLSTNEIISPEDPRLYQGSVDLTPWSSEVRVTSVTVPSDIVTGPHYVGVLLDPDLEVPGIEPGNDTGLSDEPILVLEDRVRMTTSSLPAARIGGDYSTKLNAAGGDGSYRWSIVAGELPPGLQLSEDGWLEGRADLPEGATTSEAPWSYSFQTLVRSGGSTPAQASFTLIVDDDTTPLGVATQVLPSGAVGFEYRAQLFAAGGVRPYAFSLADGLAPPAGLSLTSDGLLSGVPLEAGTHDLIIEVIDERGEATSSSLELLVLSADALVISTRDLPPALLDEAYSANLEAAGGAEPHVWSHRSATPLPAGLTLAEDGTIAGVPEETGAFEIVFLLEDAEGRGRQRTFSLVVTHDSGIGITTRRLPDATFGELYEVHLEVSGGTAPYRWRMEGGSLPEGLSLDEREGRIHGLVASAAEDAADHPFIIEVSDAAGREALRALAISVGPAPPVLAAEGCSTSAGGSTFGLVLLIVAAGCLFGFGRRFGCAPRPRRLVERGGGRLSSGWLSALLFASLIAASSCGEKNLCAEVTCPAGAYCSEADGECRCGGPGGELCGEGQVCDPVGGRCHDSIDLCEGESCPPGLTCDPDDGVCKCGGTGGAICVEPERCCPLLARCVLPEEDPCAGVDCAGEELCCPLTGECLCGDGPGCGSGERCEDDLCVESACYGAACTGGTTCDPADGECRCGGAGGPICLGDEVCDPGAAECLPAGTCLGITCPAGMSCDPSDATCKCGGPGGIVCGPDQICSPAEGLCLGGDLCLEVSCPENTECDPSDGLCKCGGPGGEVCGEDERCLEPAGHEAVCTSGCSWLDQDCPEDLACYHDEESDGFFCAEPGLRGEAQGCRFASQCAPGLHCHIDEGIGMCRKLCDPPASPPEPGSCASDAQCLEAFSGTQDLGICELIEPYESGPVMIAPDLLDLGTVQVGCASREREICIYNTSQSDITVSDPEIVIDSPIPDIFVISSLPPGLVDEDGVTLQPGERVCLNVEFRPSEVGQHTAALQVSVPWFPNSVANLEGVGAVSAVMVDTFAQPAEPTTDILFVIDDHAVMNPYQVALQSGLESFFQRLVDRDLDYNVGVVTTDARDSHGGGILRPLDRSRPHIVTSLLPDPMGTFLQNAAVGTSGDFCKAGFHSVEKLFQPSYLMDWNAGFLREEAHLALIFISAEDDASPGRGSSGCDLAYSFDYYLDMFRLVKGFGRPEMLTVSVVASTDSQCGYGGPHYRYIEMAERTGGLVSSICSEDWWEGLDLASMVLGQRVSFPLTSHPVSWTLDVTVLLDGTTPVDAQFWEYDEHSNAVVFDRLARPQPGDAIQVTYEMACLP